MATNMMNGPDGWVVAEKLANDYRLGVAQARAQRLGMEAEQRECFQWVSGNIGGFVVTQNHKAFSPRGCYAVARLIRGYGAPTDYWRFAAEYKGDDTREYEPVADWYRLMARVVLLKDGGRELQVKLGRAPGYESYSISEDGTLLNAPSPCTRCVLVHPGRGGGLYRIEAPMWVETMWNYGGVSPPALLDDGYDINKLKQAAAGVETVLQNLRDSYRRSRGLEKSISTSYAFNVLAPKLGPPTFLCLLSQCRSFVSGVVLVLKALLGLSVSDIAGALDLEESEVVFWHYLVGEDYVSSVNGCAFGGRSGTRLIGPIETRLLRERAVGHLVLRSDGVVLSMYGDNRGHGTVAAENASVDHVGYPQTLGADDGNVRKRRGGMDEVGEDWPLMQEETEPALEGAREEDEERSFQFVNERKRDQWEQQATHVTVRKIRRNCYQVTGFVKRESVNEEREHDNYMELDHRIIRPPSGKMGVLRACGFVVDFRLLAPYIVLVALIIHFVLKLLGVSQYLFLTRDIILALLTSTCFTTFVSAWSGSGAMIRCSHTDALKERYCPTVTEDSILTYVLGIKLFGQNICLMHKEESGHCVAACNTYAYGIPKENICAGIVADVDGNLRILEDDGNCAVLREAFPIEKRKICEAWRDTRATWHGSYPTRLKRGLTSPLNGNLGTRIAVQAMMKALRSSRQDFGATTTQVTT